LAKIEYVDTNKILGGDNKSWSDYRILGNFTFMCTILFTHLCVGRGMPLVRRMSACSEGYPLGVFKKCRGYSPGQRDILLAGKYLLLLGNIFNLFRYPPGRGISLWSGGYPPGQRVTPALCYIALD
jgi:hypothetical protein